MLTRRQMLFSALAGLSGGALLRKAEAATPKNQKHTHAMPSNKHQIKRHYTLVVTPNGSTLPYKMKNGIKEFHLIAEPVEREFGPDMKVKCWGYNGQTPGPTIEAVEGDRVRILVTNKLAEHTSIHWHGIFLPNGMDGVGGLTQPQRRFAGEPEAPLPVSCIQLLTRSIHRSLKNVVPSAFPPKT